MDQKLEFPCILCNYKLESKDALQEHFRKHANKEIPSEKIKIISKPKLKNDIKSTEKVPCDLCSMEFTSTTLAIQHKYRKHPQNVSKHYCGFCGMQFPIKYTRDKHLPIHGSSKPEGSFPCTDCGTEFVTKSGREYHIKSAHYRVTSLFQPVNTPLPSKKIRFNNSNEAQSVYYCYLCGSEYIQKFNLQKHLEKSHTANERDTVPEQMIRCTTCEALFYTKKAYETHALYHKPDDLYVTSEEQRLQTVSRVDQDFDIRRVQLPTEKYIPPYKFPRKNHLKNLSEKLNRKISDSDEELSPTSEPDSSDSDSESLNNETKHEKQRNCEETKQAEKSNDCVINNREKYAEENEKTNNPIPQKSNCRILKQHGKNLIKKRIYAILSPDGSIKEIQKSVPKNAVLAKKHTIKLTNSNILKSLLTSTKQDEPIKKNIIVQNKCKMRIESLIELKRNNIKPVKTYAGKKKVCDVKKLPSTCSSVHGTESMNPKEVSFLDKSCVDYNKPNTISLNINGIQNAVDEKNEHSISLIEKPRIRVLNKELFYENTDCKNEEKKNLSISKPSEELLQNVSKKVEKTTVEIKPENIDCSVHTSDLLKTCMTHLETDKVVHTENFVPKKIIKIILDRLPEKYEHLLQIEKSTTMQNNNMFSKSNLYIPSVSNQSSKNKIKTTTIKNIPTKKNRKRKL